MADRKIDYDRGVQIYTHPLGNIDVYMYVDEPGVYLNAFGVEVSEEMAAQAGYPVEQLRKARQRKERMAQAMVLIEKELELVGQVRDVVKENKGFKVVHIGLERYHLEDPDGGVLTAAPVNKAQALKLLGQLVK